MNNEQGILNNEVKKKQIMNNEQGILNNEVRKDK
jgi:hypothetical protein